MKHITKLKTADLAQVSKFASNDDLRQALNGVRFIAETGKPLILVATDGKRRHLSGGEQTPDSPFDWPSPPVKSGATQFSPLAVAGLDLFTNEQKPKWPHS